MQIKKKRIPKAEQDEMWREYDEVDEAEDSTLAAAKMVVHDAFAPRKHSILRRRGIEPRAGGVR